MPRIALQLNQTVLDAISQMTGVEDPEIYVAHPYVIIDNVSPTEFIMKLVSEEEIFEEAAKDSELEIIAFPPQ